MKNSSVKGVSAGGVDKLESARRGPGKSTNKTGPLVHIPRDEWEKELLEIAIDAGVSLSDEAVSRESIYP